ncbi:hypothetical protein HYE82_22280 [Streptomyces sp. BR123]|uniref:hypothetical protein n=1 Tax=Streptomyces sp. BR123 TaxID=2749828 RepID=UPI0015C4525D|nr:hypothetical protein [Streptomyces sp. BR123]NXY97058.1 hypothetical protein [Streptomyces sp. BR123]
MARQTWRWVGAGWLALVLASGALTLYLDDADGPPSGPAKWERVSPPSGTPRPCPGPTGRFLDGLGDCAYWERR